MADRKRANETQKKSVNMKRFIFPVIVVLVMAIAIGAHVTKYQNAVANGESIDPCPGHWHAMLGMQIEDARVGFTHSSFQNAQNAVAPGFHIHADDGILHNHPASPRCTPFEDAMEFLGVKIVNGNLVVAATHGAQAGTYNGTDGELVIYRELYNKDWQKVSWESIAGKQSKNGERIFIGYNVTDIDAALASVPAIPDNYQPPTPEFQSPPVIAYSVIGLLALYLWFRYDQKMHS